MSVDNTGLINHFQSLSALYRSKSESHKANAFSKSASAIAELTFQVTNVDQLSGIKGFGGSSRQEASEYLEKGTSDRLTQMQAEAGDTIMTLDKIRALKGIPFMKALVLVKQHRIKDLAEASKRLQNGEIVDAELEKCIDANLDQTPYIRVQDIEPEIRKLVQVFESNGLQYQIAGSYRRKRPWLKDIDVVVVSDADTVYGLLKSNDYEVQYGGKQKVRVKVATINGKNIEADISICKSEEFATTVLYLTGSRNFNIRMRSIAKTNGMTLNEHGLFFGEERQNTPTEETVFKRLVMEYVAPENRR